MSEAEEAVKLVVRGVEYAGWERLSITRTIEAISGTFQLSLSEPPGDALSRPVSEGDPCAIKIGSDTVITGYLDTFDADLDEATHEINAAGRDAAGNLVDCSAMNRPGEWRNRTALQLVAALCEPFGIAARATTAVGKPFASFKLQEGETAFEAIDRICKARALLPVSDAGGGVVLMRSGELAPRIAAPLTQGINIKRVGGRFSMAERYSEIVVKGQQTQLDGMTPSQAAGPAASAKDPTVPRYRPLIVISDEEGDGLSLKERATWEVNLRSGRSRRGEVTVQGWRNQTGALWSPNTIVPVHAPAARIEREMLITTVRHQLDADGGSLTTLCLAHPKSFNLVAIDEEKKASGPTGEVLTGKPKYVGAELVKAPQ